MLDGFRSASLPTDHPHGGGEGTRGAERRLPSRIGTETRQGLRAQNVLETRMD